MPLRPRLALALLALTIPVAALASAGARTCEGPLPLVAVRYLLNDQGPDQVPERVEAAITVPLERSLAGLPRLVDMISMSGHGAASFDLRFEGGATAHDLALVKARVDALAAGAGVQLPVRSVSVFLTHSCMSRWPWGDDKRQGRLAPVPGAEPSRI